MSKHGREQNRRAREAAAIARREREQRRRRRAVGGGVAVLLVVVVAVGAWLGLRGSGGADGQGDEATPPAKVEGTSLVVGPDSAATKATVYEDFQCPFCREFESSSHEFLRKAAADGRVQVTYKPIAILTQDDYSARALSAWKTVLDKGTAAEALDFHDELYAHQPYEDSADKPGTAKLRSWAEDAGVRKTSVLDAIGPVDQRYVATVNQAAVTAQVQRTPTVVVDGKALTASTMSGLTEQLESAVTRG